MRGVKYNKSALVAMLATAVAGVVFLEACRTDYSREVGDYFERILGEDLSDFQVYGQPRTSPTIGHVYEAMPGAGPDEAIPGPRSRTNAANWLPDDTSEEAAKAFFNKVVDTGESASISSTEEIETATGLDFSAPIDAALSEVGLQRSQKAMVSVTVSATRYLFQELLWDELHDRKDLLRPRVAKIVSEELGDIVVINKAILIDGYKATISIADSVDSSVSLGLDGLADTANFGFSWTKGLDGEYVARAEKPLVIAVQFSVPLDDPTRSSGQTLEPVKLSEEEFRAFQTRSN